MNRIIRWFKNKRKCPICGIQIGEHGLWSLQKCTAEVDKIIKRTNND